MMSRAVFEGSPVPLSRCASGSSRGAARNIDDLAEQRNISRIIGEASILVWRGLSLVGALGEAIQA